MKRKVSLFVLFFFLAALLLPGSAFADNLFVQCGADPETLPPGTFPSITLALSTLPINSPFEPHTITVTGTCVENVSILARQNITLQAPHGETATIVSASTDPNTAPPTLRIERSRNIQIYRLALQGGRPGLRIWGSNVQAVELTIENSLAHGVAIADNSTVQFFGTLTVQNNGGIGMTINTNSTVNVHLCPLTIRNNRGAGLTAGGYSTVTLGADDPNVPTLIADNGGRGMSISSSYVTINGNTTIENNGGSGVVFSNSRLALAATLTQNTIRGNAAYGIVAQQESVVNLSGQNLIQNHPGAGIYVVESTLSVGGTAASDGSLRVTEIEGNAENGIVLGRNSAATLGGAKIRNNGSFLPDRLPAGILLVRNSTLSASNIEVSDNTGPGISAQQLCNLRLENVTISGNSAEGVLFLYLSVAQFVTPGMISGNGGAPIACDPSSMALAGQPVTSIIKCSAVEEPKKK